MMPSENNGWKWYSKKERFPFPYAEGFYQKRIFRVEGDREYITAEIIQYPPLNKLGPSWEVEVNIHGEIWTKIKLYTYRELNLEQMEKDARELALRFKDKFEVFDEV